MTIDLEKSAADGRRAVRKARRRASKVVDQARSVDVPTLNDLVHRLDQVPGELEKVLHHQVGAAKSAGRVARRKARAARREGLASAIPTRSRPRRRWRATGIVVGLGVCIAVIVVATRKRRAVDASDTPDPFGVGVREAEEARRSASSSVRA